MEQTDSADIILEAIEVFIQHILYVRDVFPTQIFKKRRFYNAPVFVSIYPPLNNYLSNVLQTARELLQSKELDRVEVLIYYNELQILERYACQVQHLAIEQKCDDQYLLNYEQQLRSSLYKLSERLKHVSKLSSDAKFKVMLHTTKAGFVRLCHNSRYQVFPWVQESPHSEPDKREFSLLPLLKLDTIGLRLHAEIL